jgi:hypothetical protein
MDFKRTPVPTHCPWGKVEFPAEIAPGIWTLSTPSHGGIVVSAERRAAMPAQLRDFQTFAGGNWYEEDCDWCVVALAFPEYFSADVLDAARLTYKGWIEPKVKVTA